MWNPFKHKVENLFPKVYAAEFRILEKQVADTKRRLDCVDKFGDHEWVFVEKRKGGGGVSFEELCSLVTYTLTDDPITADFHEGPYRYKCISCGHTRGFNWIELTKDEREALTLLGLGKI